MIPVIVSAFFIEPEFIISVCLSVSVKHFGTAVSMIVSLQNNIDIICIKYRSELCTQDHTVCIGVIKTGSINVLMNGYHTPFCIWICTDRFFDRILMFCNVVIVCV